MPVSLTMLYQYASPRQRVAGSASLQARQQSVLLGFLIFANLVGEKWYLGAVLICISLIMGKVEHLFICLSTIFITFGGGELSVSFPRFLSHFWSFHFKELWNALRGSSICAQIPVSVMHLAKLSPSVAAVFCLCYDVFLPSKIVFLFMTQALLMSDATFSIC